MSQTRRHFSAEQKARIVRRHLAGKEPVSKLAEEFSLQPSQIHIWVNQVLDQAQHAFVRSNGRPERHEKLLDQQVDRLKAKLVEKNEVIAELMQEHVQLKKELGEP
jgi:transposase